MRTQRARWVRTARTGRLAPRAPRTVRTGYAYQPLTLGTYRVPWPPRSAAHGADGRARAAVLPLAAPGGQLHRLARARLVMPRRERWHLAGILVLGARLLARDVEWPIGCRSGGDAVCITVWTARFPLVTLYIVSCDMRYRIEV